MQKMKTTRKFINESYYNKIAFGYCEAQTILQFYEPFGYTCGVYGWNFDAYFIDGVNVCITTGYRGMISDLAYNYKELEELEKNARILYYENPKKLSYEEIKKTIQADFEKWLLKVRKENNRI